VGARSGSFCVEIVMSDVFDNFELRDCYGDVRHHLLVQDTPSFIQKYTSSTHVGVFVVFAYISTNVSVFGRFPCSGPSQVFSCPP
jgi:hypothetical protein